MSRFIKNFLKSPKYTGAIVPSSDSLAEVMTDLARLKSYDTIVEFGPGTGVFTEKILKKKSRSATFFALEVNPEFADLTRKKCPDAVIYNDCAQNIASYLRVHNKKNCSCIISGLPWAAFDDELQNSIMKSAVDSLSKGGIFMTFAYLHGIFIPGGRRFRHKLLHYFSKVRRSKVVWCNIPPAFVYLCEK
jgi:phospholipid N-methyltransferase